MIVETDENTFRKMKYGKSKPVNGQLVFGGVERGINKWFFKVVDKRNKDTLLPIIQDWVLLGSVIISNCRKTYDCLKDYDYELLHINNSLHYKHLETMLIQVL